jgi:hypothetical protein
MEDIGLTAVAMDPRGIGATHANVVQHGGFLDKLDINGSTTINKALGNRCGQVSNLTAMRNQHPVIVVTGCIVSFNNG